MSDMPEDGTPALRKMLLSAKPSDFGLVPTPALPRVWAAMLELRFGESIASLVAVAEGSTSLYLSTGGGVIGGGEHESVRKENRKFLGLIEKTLGGVLLRPRGDHRIAAHGRKAPGVEGPSVGSPRDPLCR